MAKAPGQAASTQFPQLTLWIGAPPLPSRPKLNEENLAAASDEPSAIVQPLPEPETTELPQAIRALRNANFRLFWAGNFTSNIGTWMQNVAQGWLVLTLTNSAFWLGVVGFAGSIPFLFVTLFGGVIADRVNKRRLLQVTQTIMMLLAFLLAGLTYFHAIRVWGVAAIAFGNGVAMAMNAPSYQALVPKLVKREDLTNAIALNSAQFNMSRILGPTLGGYAMVMFGMAGNFFLNGLSFLAVLWALVRIDYPEEEPSRHQSMWDSLQGRLCLPAQQSSDVRHDLDDSVRELFRISVHHVHSLLCESAAACGRKRAGLAAGVLGGGIGAGCDDDRYLRRDSPSRAGADGLRDRVFRGDYRVQLLPRLCALAVSWHFLRASAGS